jgi:hypothetical protein
MVGLQRTTVQSKMSIGTTGERYVSNNINCEDSDFLCRVCIKCHASDECVNEECELSAVRNGYCLNYLSIS